MLTAYTLEKRSPFALELLERDLLEDSVLDGSTGENSAYQSSIRPNFLRACARLAFWQILTGQVFE